MSAERIYVAARFGQYERARAFMDALSAAGHVVTHDWTRTAEFGDDGHPHGSDDDLSHGVKQAHALDDHRGVRTADLVVVLADTPLCGALIETGMALAFGVPVWIVAPWRETIFWSHPGITCLESEYAALHALGIQVEAEAALGDPS